MKKSQHNYAFIDSQNLNLAIRGLGWIFICIFKPTLEYKDGTTKGNCDAELVLQSMLEYPNYDRAIIVTGDGDFYCLVKLLIEKGKLEALIVPNEFKFSALLRLKMFRPYLRFMNGLRGKLEYKKKRPPEDGTSEGNLSRW